VIAQLLELGILLVSSFSSSDSLTLISLEGGEDDLPKMPEPQCRADRELDDLRPETDDTATALMGLCESGMSASVAERIE
jgi:hypothetical protein